MSQKIVYAILGVLVPLLLTATWAQAPPYCQHRGRADSATVVPATVSPENRDCTTGQVMMIGGTGAGTQASWTCPVWITSGMRYHAAEVKQDHRIAKSVTAKNTRSMVTCSSNSILWGLVSRHGCAEGRAIIFQRELDVLLDEPCPIPEA